MSEKAPKIGVAKAETSETPLTQIENINAESSIKASFYLTKVAHMLLPQFVPDIGVTDEGNSFEHEGFTYKTPENDGEEIELSEEVDKEIEKISETLDKVGLTPMRLDTFSGSYSAKDSSNVRYVRTFTPWEKIDSTPPTLELAYDEKRLEQHIKKSNTLSTQDKEVAMRYLQEIKQLYTEEQSLLEKTWRENLEDGAEELAEISNLLEQWEVPDALNALNLIITKDEALKSDLRESAKEARGRIFTLIRTLEQSSTVSKEQIKELWSRHDVLKCAVGAITHDRLEHR